MAMREGSGQVKIEYPLSSPTALRLSAAVLTATLAIANAAQAEEYAKALVKQDMRWPGQGASHPSFQGVDVLYSQTAATTKPAGADPWQDLEALEDDWDANGAQAVSRDAIDHAKRFLKSLAADAELFIPFAYPDGSVGLESHKGQSAAYLVVSATDRFTYVLQKGETVHRGYDVEPSKMREILALLY